MASPLSSETSATMDVLSMVTSGEVFNFVVKEDSGQEHSGLEQHQIPKELTKAPVFIQVSEPWAGEKTKDRMKNALGMDRFCRELETQFANPRGRIYQCVNYSREDHSFFTRGYIVCPTPEDDVGNFETEFRRVLNQSDVDIFNKRYVKYTYDSERKRISWHSITWMEKETKQILAKGSLVPCVPSVFTYHPAFITPGRSSLFHSYEDALDVLKEIDWENKEKLLATLKSSNKVLVKKCQHPFVVVEGLDGAGKTTLAKRLRNELENATLQSFPEALVKFREYFYSQPDIISRAYYYVMNFLMTDKIAVALRHGPVIVDRFWHSTVAYAMANEVKRWGLAGLPPEGHWAYEWPADLIKPTIILYVFVNEEVRNARLLEREGEDIREEEAELQQNSRFRDALDQAFRRMSSPSVIPIDGSGSPDEVLAKALQIIRKSDVM